MGLRKGSYYHSSLGFMGIFNIFAPLWGLPFVTGSLPHSPQLVRAMTARTATPGRRPDVNESRIAPLITCEQVLRRNQHALICPEVRAASVSRAQKFLPSRCSTRAPPAPFDPCRYILIGSTLLLPRLIECIPAAAVDGTLIFVGIEGLFTTQLWERFLLIFEEPALYPRTVTYTGVSPLKMHAFTAIQLICWTGCHGLTFLPGLVGLSFPVVVASLPLIRIFLLPKCFSEQELAMLDSDEEPVSGDGGSPRFDPAYVRP